MNDRPILTAAEDRLGRGRFVEALVRQLGRADRRDSTVFALYGPWGTGKSSILNLVEESLKRGGDAIVLRFNPWLFSGTEQLVGHFFRDLAAQLKEQGGKKLASLAQALEEYGVLIGPLGALPVVGPWVEAFGGALKAFLKWKGKELATSVEGQRKELIKALEALDKRLVVLVDDIDRLQHSEIRDVMRLVRLVADFPNTEYLLAFDRARVVEALAGQEGDGQAYLEKIVQAAFDVPRVAEPDLTTLLLDVVNAQLKSAGVEPTDEDATNIFVRVVRPLFSTAREVKRYASSMALVFDVVGDEVNGADLLALEAVRAIHPELIEQLRDLEGLLAADEMGLSVEEDRQKTLRARLEAFFAAGGPHAEALREFLKRVFPHSRRYLDNYWFQGSFVRSWRAKRRVAHQEVLRVYLEKRLAEDALPTRTVKAALNALGDRQQLTEVLSTLDAGGLEYLLERLAGHEDEFRPEMVETAVEVILGARERLREGSRGFFDSFGSDGPLQYLLARLLRAAGAPPAPLGVVKSVLGRLPTLSGKLLLLRLIGTGATDDPEAFATKSEVEALRQALADETAAASAAQLQRERDLLPLLRHAKATGAASQEHLLQLLKDDDVCLALLRSALSQGFSVPVGDAAVARRDVLPWKQLSELAAPLPLAPRILAMEGRLGSLTDTKTRTALQVALILAREAQLSPDAEEGSPAPAEDRPPESSNQGGQ